MPNEFKAKNGVITPILQSTATTGTAPLVVASTTRVSNLNVATAGTADTLTTARTINGTSFNGSADITTNSWGTSRTLTIGSTGKSVNGSANVSWSLSEIGAVSAADTLLGSDATGLYSFTANLDWSKPAGWQAHIRGTSTNPSVVGTPRAADYWYYTVMGRRDTGTGYAGTLIDYNNGDMYFTSNQEEANLPTWRRILHDGNYTSFSPTLTGTGASGTWGINITGNAATVTDGVYLSGTQTITGNKTFSGSVAFSNTINGSISGNAGTVGTLGLPSTVVNNEVNKIVRTDGSGYIQAGWINTISGDSGTVAIDRVYASSDGYIRYYTPANFRTVLDVPTRGGLGASGTWPISITGSSRLLAHVDGPRNLSDRNPNWNTRTAIFDFVTAGTVGTGGTYAGVLTFVPWDGTTASTGDASYQLVFGGTAANSSGNPQLRLRKGIDTTWNSWIDIITSANFNSYSPTLTGSGASGTWSIDITGRSRGVVTSDPGIGAGGLWVTSASGLNVARNGTAYLALDAGNYTSYSPSLTGTGASGDWNIRSASLYSNDNRIIAPNEDSSGNLRFGFTTWNNNNASPYADYLHLRSYVDGSGGNDNLVLFRKDTIGMRIYQQTFGSATAYSTYKDIAFTDGTNASGSWPINVTGSAGSVAWTNVSGRPTAVSSFSNDSGYITSAYTGFMLRSPNPQTGINSNFNSSAYRFDPSVNNPTNEHYSVLTYGNESNVVGQLATHYTSGQTYARAYNTSWSAWRTLLDSSNYSSYALPLSGGTVTGASYFRSNSGSGVYLGATNSPPLQVYSNDGGAAFMSFHRSGSYAVNIGLDPDNVLRIGGWSASSNRLQLNMYGDLTIAGALFPSNQSTSYYTADSSWNYFYTQYGYVQIGPANADWAHIYTDRPNFYFNKNLYVNGSLVLHAGNYNSYSPTLTGTGASGTWNIAINNLTLNNSASPINPDNVTQNQLGYNTSVNLFGQTDGGLYSSAFSSSWIHQIYGDFRTGQIAIRGKNSGTWQAWRSVLDSGNYSSYALPITGGTLTGQLIIGATGAAGSPSLRINTSTSSTFVHTQENLAANLTAGQTAISLVGQAGSTKNSGYIGYYWAGEGSNSNYVSIGHWNADHLLRVYGDGVVIAAGSAIQSGTAFAYDNSGGWGANLVAAGTNHARMRLRATSYNASGDRETYLWLDNTVSPATGLYSNATTFNFNGSISTVQVNGNTILHAGNYNSYSPTLTGGGASGSWGISITGNAATVGGLSVHTGNNNEANKIVRTDGNGYIQAGYIQSPNGNEGNNSSPARVWGTNGSDSYLRTYLTSALSVAYASSTGTATQANNLNGGSAQAIVYQSAAGTTAFLAAGTSGQVLTSNGSGSAPTWQSAGGGTPDYVVQSFGIV